MSKKYVVRVSYTVEVEANEEAGAFNAATYKAPYEDSVRHLKMEVVREVQEPTVAVEPIVVPGDSAVAPSDSALFE